MNTETGRLVLTLAGPQKLREAARTRADILAALAEPGDLLLDCAGVTEADLSFIQVILAAHRSAFSRGKNFALAAAPEGALRSALERGGFSPLHGAADPASWAGREASP